MSFLTQHKCHKIFGVSSLLKCFTRNNKIIMRKCNAYIQLALLLIIIRSVTSYWNQEKNLSGIQVKTVILFIEVQCVLITGHFMCCLISMLLMSLFQTQCLGRAHDSVLIFVICPWLVTCWFKIAWVDHARLFAHNNYIPTYLYVV
jgi:hypothetical protein